MNQNLERRLLATHALPDIELLVAGHHGAKSSTGTDLLEALRPEVVAVSVGVNSYEMCIRDRPWAAAAFHGNGVKLPGAESAGSDLGAVHAHGAGEGQGKILDRSSDGSQIQSRELRQGGGQGNLGLLYQNVAQPVVDGAVQEVFRRKPWALLCPPGE